MYRSLYGIELSTEFIGLFRKAIDCPHAGVADTMIAALANKAISKVSLLGLIPIEYLNGLADGNSCLSSKILQNSRVIVEDSNKWLRYTAALTS